MACELGAAIAANGLDCGCGRNASHQRVTVPRAWRAFSLLDRSVTARIGRAFQLTGRIVYHAHGITEHGFGLPQRCPLLTDVLARS